MNKVRVSSSTRARGTVSNKPGRVAPKPQGSQPDKTDSGETTTPSTHRRATSQRLITPKQGKKNSRESNTHDIQSRTPRGPSGRHTGVDHGSFPSEQPRSQGFPTERVVPGEPDTRPRSTNASNRHHAVTAISQKILGASGMMAGRQGPMRVLCKRKQHMWGALDRRHCTPPGEETHARPAVRLGRVSQARKRASESRGGRLRPIQQGLGGTRKDS